MDFGIVLQTDPPARDVVRLMKDAEAAGFRYGWTFDSCVLWQEPFVIYSAILAATSSLVVGPMVTSPGTRDWSVLASTFATLNDMYGNRTVCGIGRGDSAHRVVGKPPSTLATVRDCMRVVKDLAEGRSVTMNEKTVQIPWISNGQLEMWMAGYGPKALQTVGEHADGFILQCADPAIARWTIGAVRDAARAAGRDPAGITICVAAPAYVGEDVAHQREQLRWFGGMVGNHVADLVARYGSSGAVPRELTDYIREREGYDYSHHGKAGNPSTEFVPDEIVDRFCLLGPASAHVERLQELADLGVDQFSLYLMHDDREATLASYGSQIIPKLTA
ncbi:coenzyme F420-dependent N5,N10-methenyltetrahydromethanopterin reductase [Amycolatopsis mediterranei S699]|uniref:Coenzyme F420-dependent N5,N10-methenyltetrahydromethanopterin reductase n=2 Tax=Amycolatopsis mediterranei TaxID=33910 RepID=A0A0H3DDS0_AMYMU|nr:TIGR03842 family LLM class F420-dependent oxidoreductase [Amycolatopsis mediterranei]ADJ48372.1 coenzyme F420-dependent N5,N10-methenyltetrahydromethanopterin reductase [Amycolatopsis mediterranei U32]AEK45293.1 coenzyme F420-dependent N5,N10-methenyltetrahydromethanopterin reductase [Amycolatopsis mediterranei S699]AFO80083.1 coenzyme F420-dependent N5,N10-methenyltetrahydromethanopterin reductase [Amycolatopsis mediterranei S699]AGT87211.1 coenzyme F420-dependent N5,N10-methenyltetrahydrom